MFVIGSFKNYKNPFKENEFIGYFEEKKLVGLAVLFKRFGNFVINADNLKIIEKLLDYGIKKSFKIDQIAAFKKYADIMIQRLNVIHCINHKKYTEGTVLTLNRRNFKNFSHGNEEIANETDIDELVIFTTGKKKKEITKKDKKRIFPNKEFIYKINGKIVSKANTHGISKHYFQIGGVLTLKEYRRCGYARKVVSKLCEHYFNQGIKQGLLFTANDNIPALNLYKNIGFKPIDKFIIAEF